jgi:glycosyltransferase involved in cell wall biosynthesis
VIAVSKGIGEELSRITRVDAARIRVIYNGVVTADFQQRASANVIHPSFQKGTPVFVAVGRLHKQKDYPTLLRAFAQVLRQRQAELVILGEGDERDELQALATELGIAAHVDFAGFCANPLPLMRQASAVVMSSKFEGFGNVLAEALACGTSVVSTDCPYGPGEILANGRFGLLTPVGEPGALAEAMLRILDAPFDPDLLQGRAKAFEIARCGSHYIDFFEAVLRREEVRVVGTA